MHNTGYARGQKPCTIRTCLRLSGPLHRTSTSSHGGEATGTWTREPYPCPRQRHGSAHTRAPRTRPPQPAPVAQWIEQAPSKRLAAGSSPAGGAQSPPSFGRAFLLLRLCFAGRDEAPGPPTADHGPDRGPHRGPDSPRSNHGCGPGGWCWVCCPTCRGRTDRTIASGPGRPVRSVCG